MALLMALLCLGLAGLSCRAPQVRAPKIEKKKLVETWLWSLTKPEKESLLAMVPLLLLYQTQDLNQVHGSYYTPKLTELQGNAKIVNPCNLYCMADGQV